MDIVTLLVLALGLSMDAFAVSVSNSLCYEEYRFRQGLAAAAAFGLFQGLMPLLGFAGGRLLAGLFTAIDHWVALVLLLFIGIKMLVEGVRSMRSPEACPEGSRFTPRVLAVQALATSIDALAVGVSFAALAVDIWGAVALIAGVTFACCIAGYWLGRASSALLGRWAQVAGGLMLCDLGIKIFVEHMMDHVF